MREGNNSILSTKIDDIDVIVKKVNPSQYDISDDSIKEYLEDADWLISSEDLDKKHFNEIYLAFVNDEPSWSFGVKLFNKPNGYVIFKDGEIEDKLTLSEMAETLARYAPEEV